MSGTQPGESVAHSQESQWHTARRVSGAQQGESVAHSQESQWQRARRVSGTEQEYSLPKAKVKHDLAWSPNGWVTVTS